MGLSWQQGPLAQGAIGTFLTDQPLPARLLYAEPLRRRMRVRFGDRWIAQSDDVVVLHEPARYPVAYFPRRDIADGVLRGTDRTTEHPELGPTSWLAVHVGDHEAPRGAWEHPEPPAFANVLSDRVAFAWHAMEAFYEEDERIVGHAADTYHHVDIRATSRELTVHSGDDLVARTTSPLVLYESGFAPRWYVPADDVDFEALSAADRQTFCPYKGLCSYWDIGEARYAAWSYPDPYHEADRIGGLVSFEPDKVIVTLDGVRQHLAPGQQVVAHGPDRGLTPDEVVDRPARGSRA